MAPSRFQAGAAGGEGHETRPRLDPAEPGADTAIGREIDIPLRRAGDIAIERDIGQRRPTGTLTVTASVLFGQIYVLPVMTEFLDLYPAVTGRLLLLDRIVHLVEEGVDVAIRIGPLPDSDLAAARVGTVRRIICGAPDYVARAGVPRSPEDLAQHRLIVPTGSSAPPEWRFRRGGRSIALTVSPRLACTTNAAAISAATSGWGLTRVLSYQVGKDLADGRLVSVLDAFEEAPLPIHVVHAGQGHEAAKIRAFVDLAVRRLRANRLINEGA